MITENEIIEILNEYKSVFDDCISPKEFKDIAKDIINKIQEVQNETK